MEVRVKAPDPASADGLRRRLTGLFGVSCVSLDKAGSEVRLATDSHAGKDVTAALSAIEHWLEASGIRSTEVILDEEAYVLERKGDSVQAHPPAKLAADDTSRRRFRVLVVDDDPTIRTLCAESLSRTGVEVLEAEDGRRGLERAIAERPDLLLLDVNMPVLDGFALAERLRADARTSDVPFVFLTGEPEPESRERAHALGAAGFVAKPFDPHAVATLVVGTLARLQGAGEPLHV